MQREEGRRNVIEEGKKKKEERSTDVKNDVWTKEHR